MLAKIFFQYSIDQKFDYHILNYPDFVWSKESLTELVNHNFYKKIMHLLVFVFQSINLF